MTEWTEDDLDTMDNADELGLASTRPDGTLRPFVTLWVVRVDGDVFVRSAHGPDNPWFRRAKASGGGRIKAGDFVRDVTFAETDPQVHAAIDDAYHDKYDRYGPRLVGMVVGHDARPVTLRLRPATGSH